MVTLPCPSTRETGSIAIRRSLCGCSAVSRLSIARSLIVMQEALVETRHPPQNEVGEELPDGVARRRTARQAVIDAYDCVQRIDLVERQRQFRRIGNAWLVRNGIAIDPREEVVDGEPVAQRRQSAVDRAGADGDQDLCVGA